MSERVLKSVTAFKEDEWQVTSVEWGCEGRVPSGKHRFRLANLIKLHVSPAELTCERNHVDVDIWLC
jgi:hypothetical protein